ncbi:MAG: SusC/RagA family TonB-linked outer membrane protein [Bacteroidales bacterium]|nr:SusC/RagA family TonB-linked outer membrane protein [Bacteroidales bacterium]
MVLLTIFNSLPVSAQSSVSGIVIDDDDLPVPGVAVYEPGKLTSGTVTDADGKYTIKVNAKTKELVFESLGFKTRYVVLAECAVVRLETDAEMIQETVVTGIYTRKADSFTGAVQSLSADELKKVGTKNVLESLKNLDPSLMILENLESGSNPNAMSSMQIRGASSLGMETTSLKSNFVSDANMPLFILDGFETTAEKIQDMDMNRVESITILKDASAKAIYGSKGGNGVIVIETKSLDSGRTAITYTGNVSLEMPDLSSYNLCNALEKLEVERREGYYISKSASTQENLKSLEIYNERLRRALEGESTYWLSKPLRIGVGNKHSLSVELGNKELKSFTTFAYNDVEGAMKGSSRKVISGDMNLAYRHKGWTFRNIMSIAHMRSSESPYGKFSTYAEMNPYFNPYDEDGNLVRVFQLKANKTYVTANPLYDASLNVVNTNQYLDFTDNFYVEYMPIQPLKIVARAGIDTKTTRSDEFYPSKHSKFYSASDENETEDEILRKGSYEQSNGTYTSFSGDLSAQFNHSFADVHDVFATAQYTISQVKYGEVTHYASGFPNDKMSDIIFARDYTLDKTPTGSNGLNRNLGLLLTVGYSFADRYMLDATVKGSASSVFGTNNKWGTFWSAGLAWNLHKERWLEYVDWMKQFKLRFSLGSSGNQNFMSNNSIASYIYYSDRFYNSQTGVHLSGMANPNLGWEQKMDYNLGLDFRTDHVYVVADFYLADTKNLVFNRTLLSSTGFGSVSDNLGLIRNKGVELSVNYTAFQKKNSYLTFLAKIALNDNRILRLSDAMKAFNDQQITQAEENKSDMPVIQYYDDMPLHSIWVVPSLGIDPISGKEVFVSKDGSLVNTWKATNLVNYGSSDPLFNGNFGFNSEIKGIGASVIFTFYGGGKKYNSTLVSMVENTNLEKNVDRRIFSDRWFEPGQIAQYRNGAGGDGSTKPTSRFVQKNDVLNLSSVSLYYEFPYAMIRKAKLSRLRLSVYGNDLFTWSSIHIERGTSYPYARTLSFAVTATF